MPRSAHFDHGYVVGLLVSDRLDSPDDADRLPDVVGATNVKPKFTRLQGQHKHPLRQPEHGAHGMLVSPVPIPAAVMADGHITGDVDASGRPLPDAQPGIWLMAGAHKVDLGGHFASFTIEVTTDHTETNPLDLYAASPYVPPTGSTVQTVLLPANGLPGQVLARTEDGSLAWVEQTGGGGGTTDHAELTNRDEPDQHPISSVTGLEDALDGKQPAGNYATNPALTAEAQARQAADSTLSDAIALRQTAEQVDARVQQVVGAAPAALDTLGEIAERLADDADAVSALTSAVAGKADAEHNHDGVYVKPADLPDVSDVVREGDSRLTDDRDPTAHSHPVTDLDATGTPSASTYLRGDGAWATPEGGGGGSMVSGGLAPYAFARLEGNAWAVPLVPVGARVMPSARPVQGLPQRMNLMPVSIGADLPVLGFAVRIATAASGEQARFGIYGTAADGGPGSLLWDSGAVDASATGVVAITTSLTLPAGTLWVCGSVSSTGVLYYGWDAGALGSPEGWPPLMSQPRGFVLRTDHSGNIVTGGYPASLSAADFQRGHDNPDGAPVIYAKVRP